MSDLGAWVYYEDTETWGGGDAIFRNVVLSVKRGEIWHAGRRA